MASLRLLLNSEVHSSYLDKTLKSVIVIPKLEFLQLDSVYLGALILSSKNIMKPIIFTDDLGGIIGANKLVLFND